MTLTGADIPVRRQGFPVELLLPSEMAMIDRLAVESGTPAALLMERAGEAVAHAALRIIGEDRDKAQIVVLCGPGNNGGDGFVAARHLARRGLDVMVGLLGERAALKGEAAEAAATWEGPTLPLDQARFDTADLVVDAFFGAGLSRAIDGVAAETIRRINAFAKSGGSVLAVDMPSGVDGATGQVQGVAVEATACVTFFRLKPGHLLFPGRLHRGALTLADIGIAPTLLDKVKPIAGLNTPSLWAKQMPVPSLSGHKYKRGHTLVLSGPVAQTGAARLAARGALRAGAGLVTVATPQEALTVHAGALNAIMTRVCDSADDLEDILNDRRKNAVVLGPGLGIGQATRDLVFAALTDLDLDTDEDEPPRNIVLDADALASFSKEPQALFNAIQQSSHGAILTPHDGEFSKLFGSLIDHSASKLERTRQAAILSGAVVVLKGPDTVVADRSGRASIAASDAPWLATAGSGDVLAGMIGGLLAQAMPPFEATSAAVWMHANAAQHFGPGLISEDIPEMLPTVLRQLFESDLFSAS